MAENIFNTIKVRIPRNMLVLKKNGKVARVRSLTNKGGIKRVNGKTSIILEENENAKPLIIHEGKYRTYEDFKQYPLMAETINKITNLSRPKFMEHIENNKNEIEKGKTKKEIIHYGAYTPPKQERIIKAEEDYKQIPYGVSYTHQPIRMNVKPKIERPKEGVEYGYKKTEPIYINPPQPKKISEPPSINKWTTVHHRSRRRMDYTEQNKLKKEFDVLKQYVISQNLKNKREYSILADENNLPQNPDKIYNDWRGWYDFLGIDTSSYPKTKGELKELMKKLKIKTVKQYDKNIEKYNLPFSPEDLYPDFTNIYDLLNNDDNYIIL